MSSDRCGTAWIVEDGVGQRFIPNQNFTKSIKSTGKPQKPESCEEYNIPCMSPQGCEDMTCKEYCAANAAQDNRHCNMSGPIPALPLPALFSKKCCECNFCEMSG